MNHDKSKQKEEVVTVERANGGAGFIIEGRAAEVRSSWASTAVCSAV